MCSIPITFTSIWLATPRTTPNLKYVQSILFLSYAHIIQNRNYSNKWVIKSTYQYYTVFSVYNCVTRKILTASSKALSWSWEMISVASIVCMVAQMLGKLRPHVISQSYWPQLRAEEIVMENAVPAYLSEALDTYTRSYEKVREDRTLRWLPHLGMLCSRSTIVFWLVFGAILLVFIRWRKHVLVQYLYSTMST